VYVYVVLYRLCAVALLKDQPFGNGEIKFASIDGSAMQPSSSFTHSVPVTSGGASARIKRGLNMSIT
jgi:hypothetical protein